MSTYASRRAADQMARDGISKLPKWGKGKSIGYATIHAKAPTFRCEDPSCAKKAGYDTPIGKRCFDHAMAFARARAASA
jgi:hypothetical protein